HEIGHVTARHSAQRYSAAVATNIGLQVLGVLGEAAGIAGAGNVASVGANLALKSYSRDQELQADELGVRYMTRAGYNPDAMATFFEKLRVHQHIEDLERGQDGASEQHNMLATHPRTADRIQQAIKLASKNGHQGTTRGAAEFLKVVDGVTFGEDPEQGVILGQTFVHVPLDIRFEVPEGYTLENLPTLVQAKDKNGNNIKFAHETKTAVDEAGGMKEYLTYEWSREMPLSNIDWLDINGMRAVTGTATATLNNAKVDVRRILIEGRDKRYYWQLQFVTRVSDADKLNTALRRTTYSFDRPSAAEKTAAQGKHIRVVNVGAGVTFDDLANSLAVKKYHKEWFEALNGIGPDDPLIPGAVVKVVK
ncbi:MAG: M48 family metalloprotease, partial [Alphaproteobacteria bacterium]|nr:M48 family metalloprotease [Alphaproteobacteria bacterium]